MRQATMGAWPAEDFGAVAAWTDFIRKVAPRSPRAFLVPARPDVVEGVGAVFEVAEELLASQRKFASDLVGPLVPV